MAVVIDWASLQLQVDLRGRRQASGGGEAGKHSFSSQLKAVPTGTSEGTLWYFGGATTAQIIPLPAS